MAASDYARNFAAPAPMLRRLFDKSKFAISTEETRYYLNGVYLHVAEGDDDGRACAASPPTVTGWPGSTPICPPGAGMPGVIVPRKTVGELRKLLEDDEAEIAVSVSETKIRFATPEITLTSKVIDGTFPDYSRVIPSGNTGGWRWTHSDFAKAVDRVATVSSERSRAVKMQLDEDRLVLSVNAPDSGAAEEELAVAYGDDKLEIGFNARNTSGNRQPGGSRERGVPVQRPRRPDPTLMREGDDRRARSTS
jgi:DNA polymerase-3 subunit beta